MSTQAFSPQGNTITFTATTTAPAGVQCLPYGNNQCDTYRVINSGSVVVFLGVGNTAAAATANAVIFSGNNAACIPLLAGTDEVLQFAPGAFFSGNTAASNAVVYITPGEGL